MHSIPTLEIRTTIAMESVCNETTVAAGEKKDAKQSLFRNVLLDQL
jgi:hypothetical protein